jgi:hypothetical protein
MIFARLSRHQTSIEIAKAKLVVDPRQENPPAERRNRDPERSREGEFPCDWTRDWIGIRKRE